jgi:Uma2 family endonuclease
MTVNRTTSAISKLPRVEEEEDDLSIEYPETDDMPMPDNDVQMIPIAETLMTLRHHFSHRSDVYVAANMFVYYRMNDNRTRVGPDVYAVIGGTQKYPRASWLVWREGKPPDFVLEIASPSTWRHDVGAKRRIYAEMGVPEYWRFDAAGRFFTPVLVGEQLEDGEYRPMPVATGDDGILRGRSPALGLDICVLPGLLLRFYDPESGQWLLTLEEESAAHQAESAARQAAEAARQAAEAALREESAARQALEDEVRRLRQRLLSGE